MEQKSGYGSVQMICYSKVVCLSDPFLLLSFLFIAALESSNIYSGSEGRHETKSIQVTVCRLLGKSEYLRQVTELVVLDLPHNILWTGSNKKQSNVIT